MTADVIKIIERAGEKYRKLSDENDLKSLIPEQVIRRKNHSGLLIYDGINRDGELLFYGRDFEGTDAIEVIGIRPKEMSILPNGGVSFFKRGRIYPENSQEYERKKQKMEELKIWE